MRKPYLDNIRWTTAVLVLLYHVCFLFNGVGVRGGIPGAQSIPAFDALMYAVYPWFMVLLFLVAGISARYSLNKRTGKQFIKERTTKLLIPSTLGLLVLHWISGYLNIKIGGGLSYIPWFLVYPISAVSGIGPLWFIQMLYLFSCIIVLFRKLDKTDWVWSVCAKTNIVIILLLSAVLWAAARLLNMPLLTMYRFGIYFVSFLIGYYILSHEEVQIAVEKIRIPMLLAAIAGAIAYPAYYFGSDYTAPHCLQSSFTALYLWAVILAILGCGRAAFNKETSFTQYMSKSSFGFYIVHYPVLLVICYILQYHCNFYPIWNYVIAMAAGLMMTFMFNEILKRIPIIRYVVLGVKASERRYIIHDWTDRQV